MAKGDFAKFVQPKIRNHNCESCGSNNWELLEDLAGDTPVIMSVTPGRGMKMPPVSINTVLLVCGNCHYTRTYALPAAADK